MMSLRRGARVHVLDHGHFGARPRLRKGGENYHPATTFGPYMRP
jgi:hypothetical protein